MFNSNEVLRLTTMLHYVFSIAKPKLMVIRQIKSWKINFNRTKEVSILIFLVVIVAAFYNTFARIESLQIEAEMYYQPYLLHFGLKETFHIFYFLILESVVAITFVVTGLIIAWHCPATPMTFLASASLMLYGITLPPPMHTLVVNLPPFPLLIRSVGVGLLVIFFYLFPNGKFAPRWTKNLAVIIVTWSLVCPFYPPLNPYNWSGLLPFIFFTTLLGTGVFAQFYRYFRVYNPQQQQQTKWVIFGLTSSVLGDFMTHVSGEFFQLQQSSDWYILMLNHHLFIFSQLLVPLSIAFSIMYYGLWKINFTINRTLIYALLTAILAMMLTILQKTLEKIFVGFIGADAVPLAAGAAVLITVLLFKPVYVRIEKIISRYFRTQAIDYSKDFIEFLPDVRNVISLSELLQALVERTVDLTQTTHGVVLLGDRSKGLRLVATHKLNPESLKSWHLNQNALKHLQNSEVVQHSFDSTFSILIPLSLPRKIKPELLGVLALGQRTNGRGYSWEEKSALKKLGQEAGLSIYIAQRNPNNKWTYLETNKL